MLAAPSATDPRLVCGVSEHAAFSTSCALDIARPIVWDVNGYYAALGVPIDAPRLALMRAYKERGGETDAWMTMALKVLVDSSTRPTYDAMPFGSLYLDDHLREAAHRREVDAITEFMKHGVEEDLAKKLVNAIYEHTEDDVISEWLGAREVQDGYVSALDTLDTPDKNPFPWSYYVWGLDRGDPELLARWQTALIEALWQRDRTRTEIAIGVHDVDQTSWKIVSVGYRTVVFLHHLECPEEHAADVALHLTEPLNPIALEIEI